METLGSEKEFPKPVTDEWTADYVRDLKESRGYITTEDGWQAVADAHNAAIAAEHENLMKLERDWHKVINEVLKCNPIPARDRADGQLEPPWEVIARIREQLAAERKNAEKAAARAELAQMERNEARQQREWLIKECARIGVTVNVRIDTPITEAYRLENTQLAAERGKCNPLVELLEWIRGDAVHGRLDIVRQIDDALANVKFEK